MLQRLHFPQNLLLFDRVLTAQQFQAHHQKGRMMELRLAND